MMRNPDLHAFLNAANVLGSTELDELLDAGVILTDIGWANFSRDPIAWLRRATDADQERVWGIVQRRSRPTTTEAKVPT